ncbi:MAG: superoxide dismutase [Fe] [Acidimicrobiia bacterium]|jgi:Fe-Mn family superoxide dismutase|nr:superoxide dismutase [Fe] [Acidimicrobiia bacterium]MBA3801846.1 superoxide dismutase [Fe] [Acidimicrobiia bacterium]
MAIELPELPFEKDALESRGLSAETIEYHYGKHHATYVKTLNDLIADTEHADADLETIIKEAPDGPLFNNSAQVWNHTFYWHCLSPTGGGEPTGEVGDAINSAFGSYDDFASEFTEAAKTQFGSGWAWLVDDGGLKIMKTANADLPLKHDVKALLTIDVWEHAYYIDWRNARPDYISNFLAQLVNWDFVAQNHAS